MCCHVLAGSRERLSWRLKGRSPRQTPRQFSYRMAESAVPIIPPARSRSFYPGTLPPHSRPGTGCLETHNRRPPKQADA
jgi:hypothetical protein